MASEGNDGNDNLTEHLSRATLSSEDVSFTLSDAEGHNMHTATFQVPRGLELQLSRNNVNARGASFELSLGEEPGTLTTTFYSSDPKGMAEAIVVRLSARIQDPSPPGAEECCVM
jgi:hypothetical protein